jgi:hypothetical protein
MLLVLSDLFSSQPQRIPVSNSATAGFVIASPSKCMLIPLSQLVSPTDKIGESVTEHTAIFAPTTLECETALVPHCSAYGETTFGLDYMVSSG